MLDRIKHLLYQLGFARVLDKLRFHFQKIYNHKANKAFRLSNPGIAIPPDKFIYETYWLNYKAYFQNIEDIPKEIVTITKGYIDYNTSGVQILDWGCGVGGNLKGLKKILDTKIKLSGCDVNCEMIEWNNKNLSGIDFFCIDPLPPVAYAENSFDLIYGISIFTHLNKKSHFLWIEELYRLLKKDGILLITTHGPVFKQKLTHKETVLYDKGELIERKYTSEGSRVFSSFHPPTFIHSLIKSRFEVLEYFDGSQFPELIGYQDKWVLKKI